MRDEIRGEICGECLGKIQSMIEQGLNQNKIRGKFRVITNFLFTKFDVKEILPSDNQRIWLVITNESLVNFVKHEFGISNPVI